MHSFIVGHSIHSSGLQLSGSNELSTINFNISIERGPTFGVVMPGGNITMDCLGHCSEPSLCRVAWYFKGFAVLPTEKQKFFPNGSLQILDFKMENGGEYMCMVASNPFARLSRSAVVELAGKCECIDALHFNSTIRKASEVLFVNHLYSAPSQRSTCGSSGWVSNTTHHDRCH